MGGGNGGSEASFREGNIDMVNLVNKQVAGLAYISIRAGVSHERFDEVYNETYKDGNYSFWSFIKDKRSQTGTPVVSAPVIVVPARKMVLLELLFITL